MKINIVSQTQGFRVNLVVNGLALTGVGPTALRAFDNASGYIADAGSPFGDRFVYTSVIVDEVDDALVAQFTSDYPVDIDDNDEISGLPVITDRWNFDDGPHPRAARSRSHSRRLNALRRNVYRSA